MWLRIHILALGIAAAVLLMAESAQAFVDTKDICLIETARTERTQAIPKHLLSAIALAESGRWMDGRSENIAWPWTVTSGGEGRFFPTKPSAIAEVRQLMARGVTNIDVGCMQINLHHHGDNFVSLNHAFDPAANVAYGAKFLKQTFKETGSWIKAATYYHSRTSKYGERYRAKVTRLWENRKTADGRMQTHTSPARQMAVLNDGFRARRAAASSGGDAPDRMSIRHDQLQAWREARIKGLDSTHVAVTQRVRKKLERNQVWNDVRKSRDSTRFKTRRRAQLRAWRLNRTSGDAS